MSVVYLAPHLREAFDGAQRAADTADYVLGEWCRADTELAAALIYVAFFEPVWARLGRDTITGAAVYDVLMTPAVL